MGCDIHVFCEAKRFYGDENIWYCVDHFKKNKYFNPIEPDGEREWEVVVIFDNRDYGLFSLLTDVRNYYENEPIDTPRGLPNDVSKEVKDESDYCGSDGHSHSYFTLKELMDYRREHATMKYSGMLSDKQIEDLRNGIKPNSWCQSTNMEGYKYVRWEDNITPNFDKLIEVMKKRLMEEFWIYDFQDDKEDRIKERSNDFRIVFWFDN